MTHKVPLTKLDRCDACGAEAKYLAELPYGDLLLCGHHHTKHKEALEDEGAVIYEGLN